MNSDEKGKRLYEAWLKAQIAVRGCVSDPWTAMSWEAATEGTRELWRLTAEWAGEAQTK